MVCTNKVVCAEHLLSFWSLQFEYMTSRGCLHDPIKALGAGSLRSFPGWHFSHILSQLITRGLRHIPWDSTAENPWKLAPSFSRTLPHAPFLFANQALFPLAIMLNENYNGQKLLLKKEFIESNTSRKRTRSWAQSEPPAVGLGEKDKHAHCPGVDRLFYILCFRGKKMLVVLKAFTLAIDKGR